MTHRSPIGVRISARRDLGIAPTNAGGGDLELVVSSGWCCGGGECYPAGGNGRRTVGGGEVLGMHAVGAVEGITTASVGGVQWGSQRG